MGEPAWATRPDLDHAAGRRAAHDEIDAGLEQWLEGLDLDEATERLLAAGIPAQPLVNPHDLYPNAQLGHRGFFQVMKHPATGETRYPGWPMKFSAWPRALHRRAPPLLGEHNDEVLRDELGLTSEEIERLREAQVIGDRPSFM
jgi:crotonobetainyl-CoA:carnitine CoA-transferase CaiB-like acyl-CoA transferase